ncbi:MAG TPA: hypothetical protein VGX25_05420 [Actinophytocola sp.]|uniref:hypothetical protein n=1 Tax=Actinophytocola sp. TaxID=1872138 RepID=UPI002DDCE3C2|nr:hypothetical protein [Actinophytocola sp.]HEV2778822.1 hypothetical protein [Actinophytocola sp.]
MALSDEDRRRVAAQWMRDNTAPIAAARAAVLGAVVAIDDWIEANQATLVTALPAAFRTGTTPGQKADLFADVLARRAGRHRAEEDG